MRKSFLVKSFHVFMILNIFLIMGQFIVAASAKSVVKQYSDMALAKYQDSLTMAIELNQAIDVFLKNPNKKNLDKAKKVWLDSRIPYQQSEVYRFGNPIVDDWEGKVNAWPLDEGLIDYVDKSYGNESDENAFYSVNIIANNGIKLDGKNINLKKITPELLSNTLHELGGVEANVATGYHAIEFLLWGQDVNGTSAGAGQRPYTDYHIKKCTNGNCDRRRDYLKSVSELLVTDLKEMVMHWKKNGAARKNLAKMSNKEGLQTMITGMGSLSYGELAGERMKLGLLLGDPEEEHDCFSDNTHNSHYYDALGIKNVYLGEYVNINGKKISGASLSSLVKAKNPKLDKKVRQSLDKTMHAMHAMVKNANNGTAYDQMIATGNKKGNKIVQKAIDALVEQTKLFEEIGDTLKLNKIEFEGSDSLDNPNAVF